ncbi:MAG: glycosyl transferase family 1 [Planctomycetes bacterium]|jgi:ATPase subunit of ABC transporter with duplicated ATPase domains|nr:glycosyl transferase family 1 [Planctomycetota bacterium]MDP7245834.1 ABC-F family ATP-binding cassette domain-containing protein [Planctomycetota bacterium]|tara:strand:+ start:66087 stop:67712 length:1626 start_codon:yes stop_codon:yes gene_type:complete
MITVEDLDYRYGSQILFQEASLKVEDNWKVGLIGPNGSGKTTLFRLITEQEVPEGGSVSVPNRVRIGYFDQRVGEMSGCDPVEQTVREAGRVHELRQVLEDLEHQMGSPDYEGDLEQLMARYAGLQNEYQTLGGYDVEARARECLAGLGFKGERMTQDVGELSGGWKMRVALAGILVQQPQILLLDEPTNHLDIESIVWLEDFIRNYRGTVMMTCHDHEFMNRVVNRIVEIDEGKLRAFPGDYDFYLEQRKLEDHQRHAAFERQQAHIEREMKWINSYRAKARKASAAQSRLKRLEKLDKLEPPRSRRQRVRFKIPKVARSGDDVFVCEELGKSFGENIVYTSIDAHIRRGERWAVLGINGAGKTTLLKLVMGELEADCGKLKRGVGLEIGYFAQHSTELLHPETTVWQTMQGEFPSESMGALRKCLAGFGFEEHDLEKPTKNLSGGEKARLVLARMMFRPPNFLVLDEPTNHLDIEAKQSLLDALLSYTGTLLFVSHDRHFLQALGDTALIIEDGEAKTYHNGYCNYVELTGQAAPGIRV